MCEHSFNLNTYTQLNKKDVRSLGTLRVEERVVGCGHPNSITRH